MKSLVILFIACFFSRLAFASEPANASVIEPKLVSVQAGKIKTATCPAGMTICSYEEYLERLVNVPAFEIAETEVTFAEWDACVKDGGCASPVSEFVFENRPIKPPCVAGAACQYPDDESWGRGKRPVINVSWDDVQLYLKWLNVKTAGHYRLPTSVEWEYAAAAGASTDFPWGAKLGKNNANCDGCGSQWGGKQTAPVASFKPNRFGLYDMLGNVEEWVSTCFPSAQKGSRKCSTYAYHGGAWSSVAKSMGLKNFNELYGMLRKNYIGFRLAR
ncbi:formylglycine-generating enzyme family protein [Undibacterium sp. JH2W]|uniref:formylglycine-generating enzyme family protein n=1 Tax=Undibacterium sp. JH2W TaxID=3413037 RepID=UPI003BF2F21E